MGPSVDVELADMATGLGVSTRKLMARVLNGGYDQIGENDLIRGDKGDPLFFRIDRRRAYSIFGDRIDEYEKDLSTVEEMVSMGTTSRENTPGGEVPSVPSSGDGIPTSPETETGGSVATSTGEEAAPTVEGNEGSRPPTARGASEASKTANVPEGRSGQEREPSMASEMATTTEKNGRKNEAPPARTDRGSQGGVVQTEQEETSVEKRENAEAPARTGQETSTAAQVGKTALAVAGVYAGAMALVSLLSGGQGQNQQARGLSGRQKQDLFDQGYYGYYQGVEYNPYDPATEEGKLYEQGWMEGRRQAIKNPAVNTRLA